MKKIQMKYQSSPLESSKVPLHTQKHKGRQLVFEDEFVEHPFDEVGQEKIMVAHGGKPWPTETYI